MLSGKYRVCTIDKYGADLRAGLRRSFHNSFPEACKRVSQIAIDALPAGASEQDKADLEVRTFRGDITKAADIEAVFKAYENDGGIWGVIHVRPAPGLR